MRWEVTGSDRASGASVLRVYEAPTEEAAAEFATRDGMDVGGVDLLIEMGGFTAPPAVNVPPPPPIRKWRVEGGDRETGEAVLRLYDATTDAEAAAQAREDGVHVLRVTRADQPAPPPLDAYQAQFAAVTQPANPIALRGEPRAADSLAGRNVGVTSRDPAPESAEGPSAWDVAGFSSRGSGQTASAIPREFRPADPPPAAPPAAANAASGGFQPLDASALAAVAAAASDTLDFSPRPSRGSSSRSASPVATVEPEHPRLRAAATASFWFACAAYAVGGAALLTALVAGIAALAQQGTPAGVLSIAVGVIAVQVAAPLLFAAVVCHAISGASLALLEIVLRRRRKRDY